MSRLIAAWQDFAETLNSRGGTIALLFVATLLLGLAVMHVMHHGDDGQAAAILIGTFSNFTGALLLALTGRDKPSNGSGNGANNSVTQEKK